jgi:hypothetical protein
MTTARVNVSIAAILLSVSGADRRGGVSVGRRACNMVVRYMDAIQHKPEYNSKDG